jgi:hypothetical protein
MSRNKKSSELVSLSRRAIALSPLAFAMAHKPAGAIGWCPTLLCGDPPYRTFGFQVATALHETDATWQMLVGPHRRVYGIKKSRTGTGRTEIHRLNPDTGYRTFDAQLGTGLHETNEWWRFAVTGNDDIYAIAMGPVTWAYILTASSGYQHLQRIDFLPFGATDPWSWDFVVDVERNIYGIKKNSTASGYTDVYVAAPSSYGSLAAYFPTVQHQTDQTFAFGVSPQKDIFCIKRSNTGTGSTEVHQLARAHSYRQWVLNTGTALHTTDQTWEFGVTPDPDPNNVDVYCFKKSGTGSGRTEVHVLRRYNGERTFGPITVIDERY